MLLEKRSRISSLSSVDPLPEELMGKWNVIDSPYQIEILPTAAYHVIDTPKTYSFPDPDTLLFHVTSYKRLSGEPNSLVGVWILEEHGEEITFRADGTYSSTWPEGDSYTGTYTTTDTDITTSELRAIVLIDGKNMTLDVPYGAPILGTFEIESPTKWYYWPEGSDKITYYKE